MEPQTESPEAKAPAQPPKSEASEPAHEHTRQPSIKFPNRRLPDGTRISDLPVEEQKRCRWQAKLICFQVLLLMHGARQCSQSSFINNAFMPAAELDKCQLYVVFLPFILHEDV